MPSLDAWCGTAIDWQPLGPIGEATSQDAEPNAQQDSVNAHNRVYLHELQNYPALTVSLTSLEGTPRIIWLAMNADTLESLPELPEKWQAFVRINRHLLPRTLELQKYKLSNEELSKVGPGSLLLLSQSFQEHWRATVSAAEASLSKLDVIIATTDQVIRIAPQASISNDADFSDHASDVLVELADNLLINELYVRSVWQAGLNMVLPLPNALDGTRVVVRQAVAAQAVPSPSVWAGSLMKVGEGFGVLLDSSTD